MRHFQKDLHKRIEALEEELQNVKKENADLKLNEKSIFKSLKNHILGIAFIRGNPPEFIFVNKSLADMTGYSEEELLNAEPETVFNLIFPDDRENFFARYRKRLAGEKVSRVYEFRIVKKNGEVRWLRIFAEGLDYNGEPAVLGSYYDITERKEIEAELKHREEEYRLLFNRTPAGIFYFDKDLRITHFNDKFLFLLQSTREKLTGLDMRMLKDMSVFPCIEKAVQGEKGFYEGPYDATTSQAHVEVSMITEPLRNEKGEITGGVGIVQDITHQKETEEALEQSEERFRELVEWSPIAMAVFDVEGNIIYRNRRAIDDFGYSTEEVPHIDQWWDKAYPDPAYREKVRTKWNNAIKKALNNGNEIIPQEWKVTTPDGSVKDVEFRMMPIGGVGFVTMEDLTERKRTEAELLKAQKIESLGVLAGGIAHDFNNILTAVLGNISMARDETLVAEERSRILEVAEKAAWRARSLTQQLLTFSRGGAPVQKATSIENLLRETADFILSGSPVSCIFDLDPDLSNAHIDEGQVSQVVHNLLLNARQAIRGKGFISISAENYSNSGENKELETGEYVHIIIEDSGHGISKECMSNIYDPFFTTKEEGSGLGLSVSYSIIKKHGGNIKVKSEIDKGTRFDLFLPASGEAAKKMKNTDSEMAGITGKILVMDDDPMVLEITRKFIEYIGFSVDTAKEGEEALNRYRKSSEAGSPYDLVILDLTIRGGMGEETMGHLKKIDPGVIGVVASGYSNDSVMARFTDYGFSGVIVKPYSIDEMKETLYRLIKIK